MYDALASAAIKAMGPILVGGKELPPSANAVIALLAPALLTALVVTETFGEDGHLVEHEMAVGVGVAALALAFRAPVLLAGAPCRCPRSADHRAGKGLQLEVRDCPNQLTSATWPSSRKEHD